MLMQHITHVTLNYTYTHTIWYTTAHYTLTHSNEQGTHCVCVYVWLDGLVSQLPPDTQTHTHRWRTHTAGSVCEIECYLFISSKCRRVERSSRRLICLWQWVQKNSRDSDCRKFWKLEGKGSELSEGARGGEWVEKEEREMKQFERNIIRGRRG